MQVLVVEDQAILAFALAEELSRAGHNVIGPAKTSQEALKLAKSHRPEMALVDVDLESKQIGLSLTQQLTAELRVDVIICSGQAEVVRRANCGALGLIQKPYDQADVVGAITALQAIRSGDVAGGALPSAFELLVSPQ